MLSIQRKNDLVGVLKTNRNVVIDVHAIKWCGPCKVIAPVFHELSRDSKYSNVTFVEVDVDLADEDLVEFVGIKSVPTFILVVDGLERERFSSADRTKLEEMVKAASNKAATATPSNT